MRSEFHPGGRRRSRHAQTTVASRVVLAFLALMLVPGTPSAAAADATGVESSTTSRQPLSRQAELQGGEQLANVAPRRRLTQQNEASGPVGRYVKLIVNNFLHFNEMIVYPPGNVHGNVAAGKTVTASDVGYGGSLAGLVDGDIRGATAVSGGPPCVRPSGQDAASHTCPGGGYFHSLDASDNWVMVDLGEETAIGGIFLYQTADLGGFSRAVGLYAEILDASQNTVLTTAAVQDSRAGYLLDFSPGFVTPVDTNQWRGFDRVYDAGDALDGWWEFQFQRAKVIGQDSPGNAGDVGNVYGFGEATEIDGDTMVVGSSAVR